LPASESSSKPFVAGVVVAAGVAALLAVTWQLRRAERAVAEVTTPGPPAAVSITDTIAGTPAVARGPRLEAFTPRPAGDAVGPDDRPMIANVAVVDLDGDGLMDVVAADAATNRITWLRQAPAGRFTETAIAEVPGPAHVHAADLDRDGDLDVAVASLGVLFPNNQKIGAVVLLEQTARGRFTPHVVLDTVARVADVRSGDLDGDGDLDLSVVHFG